MGYDIGEGTGNTDTASAVRVEVASEIATSDHPASIRVYEHGKLIAEVIAKIEQKRGADGGYYPCVTLKKQ